ncbi:MAG TPA: HD domain-containing protein [Spirochaetota bacterium]|jgi:putative hydrolase of HD superfamily|nr:MAG: 5'-nucleotidase [Spirochaetes bacterium ADurb.Bin133]HNZ26887.1 HD domain-containing protein [Spirochaetota bacterium]HPY86721.1 HD domain-containing protein [Spirochaetota bacterium]HQB60023.1 HD domain-containing protein [Spirochaetota bacterium]
MIDKNLLLKIFGAFYMERWNDKLRPLPFYEIDKQSHKMMIAFFLANFEDDKEGFDWQEIIEGGIFELIQRLIITDIKPSVLRKIKEYKEKNEEFKDWIYEQARPMIASLGLEFLQKFKNYNKSEDYDNLNRKILGAAHLYASKWEFDIIERANPEGYDIDLIKKEFEDSMEKFYDLEGIKLLGLYKSYRKFIDLCGQLRFQLRWANLHRIPKTSVLGHSFFVAVFSYLFSYLNGSSPRRARNNYLTGLFHDLPEVLTRDIISPVKKSIDGLSDIIKDFEREQMEKIVYPLAPKKINEALRFYSENEFDNIVEISGVFRNFHNEEIPSIYNKDNFNVKDGALVKAVDELSAFIEAKTALENGGNSKEFSTAAVTLKEKYMNSGSICGIDFSKIYGEF